MSGLLNCLSLYRRGLRGDTGTAFDLLLSVELGLFRNVSIESAVYDLSGMMMSRWSMCSEFRKTAGSLLWNKNRQS